MALADANARHLYAHVPFCARRCSYCDFSIAVRRVVPVKEYLQGIAAELRSREIGAPSLDLDTVYLGGGTPSRLGGDGIRALLDTIRSCGTIAAGAEVTLEANPDDITAGAVRGWRDAGVNRLSIGVQSFDDRVLRWMHRTHDASTARRAVQIARDGGLSAFSLDLIFAVPDSLERDWSRDLNELLALEPEHISLYGLTVEPHTPLGKWLSRGDVTEGSEDRYASEFRRANVTMTDAGFEHYEVSNFAQRGRRARHNSAYWRGVAYLGVGPSAHGFDGRTRRWNLAPYTQWQSVARSGVDPIMGSELLTADNTIAETVYLGLRTVDGLMLAGSERAHVARWVSAGWMEWIAEGDEGRVRCTPEGWLRLDALAADLTAIRSRS